MKKKYRVRKGDNFFSIAEKLYGNPAYAATLIWANPGIYVLHPGMILKTPPIDTSTGELPVMGNAAWERMMQAEEDLKPEYDPPNMAKISKEVFGGENSIKSLPVPDEVGTAYIDPNWVDDDIDFKLTQIKEEMGELYDEDFQDAFVDELVAALFPDDPPSDFLPPEISPQNGGDLREFPIMDEALDPYHDDVKWCEITKERINESKGRGN